MAKRYATKFPMPGDSLPNGTIALDVVTGETVAHYVIALTVGRAGHPFATWRINPDTWDTHHGTYHMRLASAVREADDRANGRVFA